MPYDDQIDMSDVADMANDHGIDVYQTMSGVRQGVLNVLAVGLSHLFEQQLLLFLRRGLLSKAEEDMPALFKVAEFEKRLAECGVKCRSFSCAGKLHELRTAANAIKHGTGPAGDELAKLRPDLFGSPDLLRLEGGCFRHQLLLALPYLVLTKPLRLDIQCQRAASVKIGWKYLDD